MFDVPLSMFSFQFTPIFWTTSNQFNDLRNAAGKHGLKKMPKAVFLNGYIVSKSYNT